MSPEFFITWRKKHFKTQGDIAKTLGVNINTVSRWEQGINPVPSWMPYVMAAISYGLPPHPTE